jgi:hypothetical protein
VSRWEITFSVWSGIALLDDGSSCRAQPLGRRTDPTIAA